MASSDFPMYHWSPTTRRKQIQRRGLVPGSRSLDGEWKPPYVCFASNPELAWVLSGRIHPEVSWWDLWVMWSSTPSGVEDILDTYPDTGRSYVKEHRVYERVFKRDLWLAGSRSLADHR